MPTETNLVAIDTSSRPMVPATATAIHSTGAIAFREHLATEIDANTGNLAGRAVPSSSGDRITAQQSAEASQTPDAGKTAPLIYRLYGGQPHASGVPAHTIAGTGAGTTESLTDNTVARKILGFADAIRAPASVAAMELGTSTNTVIAFAGLETGWGKHIPRNGDHNSNNLFDIKAHDSDRPSITSSTIEYVGGEAQSYKQQFRSYQSIGESIEDFSYFLRSNPRYNEALSFAGNPKQFIRKVHEAGYATDPDYANKVIGALQQLDSITTVTGAIGIGWR